MKRWARITRHTSTDDGTFGDWLSDSGYKCVTGELPWRYNVHGKSCILPGIYQVKNLWSNHHKAMLWHILGAPGRDQIEIHAANMMGDVDAGRRSQLLGCCAPGKTIATFAAGSLYSHLEPPLSMAQMGVTESGTTLKELMKDLGDEFELTIIGA